MGEPLASRPHMPGYGIVGPHEGTGLLAWSWARERLVGSRNYWVATISSHGWPHVMPVWGVWEDESFWFSSSRRSRKTRNIGTHPGCVVTIEDALDPVVVEGTAEVITGTDPIARFLGLTNAKYETDYPIEFLDPTVNATIRVEPRRAFGLRQADFTGSPTRWDFRSAEARPR